MDVAPLLSTRMLADSTCLRNQVEHKLTTFVAWRRQHLLCMLTKDLCNDSNPASPVLGKQGAFSIPHPMLRGEHVYAMSPAWWRG